MINLDKKVISFIVIVILLIIVGVKDPTYIISKVKFLLDKAFNSDMIVTWASTSMVILFVDRKKGK